MKNPAEAVGDAWGIPKDIALDMPHITMYGDRELYIENYKSLISYNSTKIETGSKKGKVIITGKNLEIKSIRREDIMISGLILHVEYKK